MVFAPIALNVDRVTFRWAKAPEPAAFVALGTQRWPWFALGDATVSFDEMDALADEIEAAGLSYLDLVREEYE